MSPAVQRPTEGDVILHLVTHAHTRQQPALDAREWELSAAGKRQAAALVDALIWRNVAALVVSSEPKTRLTAAPVAECFGLPILCDPRFDELRRSGWIDDYAETVRAAFADPERSIAGWETAHSALARALAGIRELEEQFAGREVAIFGHGLSLSLTRAWFLGQARVDWAHWQKLPFGAWATIDTETHKIVHDFAQSEATQR